MAQYRVLYEIQETHKILNIYRVGHRKDVYQ
ncbi:MAG: type II toxin-antitoxin system RelE/ParE family toxin [Leptospiraceae bacterium]|nr:type II toxin-antitoxin system RelE/ParE family toxin [Leptospiraceae bacterium]